MKNEIIRIAREAGYGNAMSELHAPALERFYNLAVQHEREECAKLADYYAGPFNANRMGEFADAIRARGEKQ